jgi:hypothetical protein
MYWISIQGLIPKIFKCGFCGNPLSSEKGYYATESSHVGSKLIASIYICHTCGNPTYFDKNGNQTPGALIGNNINHIPDQNIEKLYKEARICFSSGAYTSLVMCCRKLLMNISVNQGASEGKNFVEYVNYLNDNNYIPPNGKEWVDSIRKLGNEANHKIEFKSKEDAIRIATFTEMLLRFIYELPGIMNDTQNKMV